MGGCDSGPTVYSVSGKITLKNQPASDIGVTLLAVTDGGSSATAKSEADGSLTFYSGNEGREGVEAGKYKVVLRPADTSTEEMYGAGASRPGGGPPGTAKPPFPEVWLKSDTSPMEVEIGPGKPNEVVIAIE